MDFLKLAINCSECSSFLDKPVTLSCGSSVCLKHLENLKNQTFACKLCDQDHHIEESYMNVNKGLEILIQANLKSLNFGPEYDAAVNECNQLQKTINHLETLIHDPSHFIKQAIDKLKNKTELIREEFKLKIDEKAKLIIEQLVDFEKQCISKLELTNLKQTIAKIDENIIKIKEDFSEWEKTLKNLGSKQNDWTMIKQKSNELTLTLIKETFDLKKLLLDHKIADYFTTVLSLQEIKQTFDIKSDKEIQEFKDILVNLDIFNSKIIDDAKRQQLLTLCNIPCHKIWKLIYRGSEHGLSVNDFRSKCDNIPNTLTIIKSTNGYIFGGYTNQPWDKSNAHKKDPGAFLFSLINPENQPSKLNILNASNAIYCHVNFGPSFGHSGNDIRTLKSNFSSLGTYQLRYSFDPNDGGTNHSYLTESQNFTISDIDIYQII